MFYKMIENKCTQWYESERCTVKSIIEYIEKAGQMRDAQIEAIKVYLFLKIACECKPLTQLFRQGFFNSIDLNEIELSKSTREYLFQNPAAAALFEYACLTNDKDEQVSEKLEKQIKKEPAGIDYNEFFRNAFYGVSYTDYLFSLPMGAGKTYLMAAFIYLDLYFAYNEPTNPAFAHDNASGEKFIDRVIDHLDERDFLLDYAKKLEKAYLKTNPKRTQNLIVQEILLRQDIISNIENYLCLVRSAETLVNDSKKSAVDICTNTLAYAMATEKEKELLIKVFQKIEENIQQYSVEKLSRYSNAMSGIGLSSLIEEWIVQNELTEKIYTETELLSVIAELYLQICGDFRYQEHIQSICKKWIDGQTPTEINNKETIGIAEVESLCNKRISYEMNFLIGNICDLIEVDGENEEQVDQRNILTLLQKKVKYGVPNMTAISICESIFNDRLLAIELAQILSDANIGTDKILNMLKAHSEEIFSCLDSYPEYFKDRLSVLMK